MAAEWRREAAVNVAAPDAACCSGAGWAASARRRWSTSDLTLPLRAIRVRYVPLLMLFFASGAIGLIDVTRDMWVKERLTLSPAELAAIGMWLTLPGTMKMVFGETRGQIPDLRVAAQELRPDRRRPDRRRHDCIRRRRRRMAPAVSAQPPVLCRSIADRDWRCDPGRGRPCHDHRSGRAGGRQWNGAAR